MACRPRPPSYCPRPVAGASVRPAARLDRRTVGDLCAASHSSPPSAAGLLVSVVRPTTGSTSNATADRTVTLEPATRSTPPRRCDTRLLGVRRPGARHYPAKIPPGRPAVVNFFSTTCAPCVTEMPAFERVHRSRGDVAFIGVDVQDQVAAGRKLIKRTGITYEALRDPPGDLLRNVGGVGLPTTVLIDAKGRVVATHTGALTERDLRSLIADKLR